MENFFYFKDPNDPFKVNEAICAEIIDNKEIVVGKPSDGVKQEILDLLVEEDEEDKIAA